jgi:hypothetical protein
VCIPYLKWLGHNTNKVKIGNQSSDIQEKPGSKTHTPSWLGWGDQLAGGKKKKIYGF